MKDPIVRAVLARREGGKTRRMHAMPHHGEYTVGQHSYDALSLLLVLNPTASLRLIRTVLWHDCAERWVGDTPAPAKWYNPPFHEQLHAVEKWVDELFLFKSPLSQEEQEWLDAVDMLEFWLWCQDQLALGNILVKEVEERVCETIADRINEGKFPHPAVAFFRNFRHCRLEDDVF